MSLGYRAGRAIAQIFGSGAAVDLSAVNAGADRIDWAGYYQFLRLLYDNNRLYEELAAQRERVGDVTAREHEIPRGLRNPTNAVVEFYVATVWPGALAEALPVESANNKLAAQVQDIFGWSNWEHWAPITTRWQAMLGEVFLKVATRPEGTDPPPKRVFIETVEPDYVSEERYDERGFLTRIRLDGVQTERAGALTRKTWLIEVWDKDDQVARFYEIVQDQRPDADKLRKTKPVRELPFANLGIDFVPFARMPFTNRGRGRGEPAIISAWDKIHELDRMATSLHRRIYRYNQPDWALVGIGQTVDGLLMPPVDIDPDDTDSMGQTVRMGGESFFVPPPGRDLKTLIPSLDYSSQRGTLSEHWDALRDFHLPELNYNAITSDTGDVSGRAIAYKLRPALSKAQRARINADASLVRACQMAMTIGAHLRVLPTIGRFEDGGLDFTFGERPFIPTSPEDEADMNLKRAQTAQAWHAAGFDTRESALLAGLPEARVDEVLPANAAPADVVPGVGVTEQ